MTLLFSPVRILDTMDQFPAEWWRLTLWSDLQNLFLQFQYFNTPTKYKYGNIISCIMTSLYWSIQNLPLIHGMCYFCQEWKWCVDFNWTILTCTSCRSGSGCVEVPLVGTVFTYDMFLLLLITDAYTLSFSTAMVFRKMKN